MFKTIIFDIGGVVTHTNFKAIYSGFAKRLGLDPEFVTNYHKENLGGLLLGDITLENFWNDMRNAGADSTFDLKSVWMEEGLKNREINKGLLDIIKNLRQKYSVGVLTNLTYSRKIFDEEMNLYSYFDFVVLSCVEHLKKPDHLFYKLALERAGAKPTEAIYIDDKENCVAPSQEIGMGGILYTYPDNEKLLQDLRQLGVSI